MHPVSFLHLLFKRVRWPIPLAVGLLIALLMLRPQAHTIPQEPHWEFQLLGPLRVTYDGKELPLQLWARERALLGYLALAGLVEDTNWPTSRLDLADEIWSEHEQVGQRPIGDRRLGTDTLKDLTAATSNISRNLERPVEKKGGLLLCYPQSVRLDARNVTSDVGRFTEALRRSKSAKTAAELEENLAAAVFEYERGGGDLLQGLETRRIVKLREALSLAYIHAKDDLARLRKAQALGGTEEHQEYLAQQNDLLTADLIAKASFARTVGGEEEWLDRLDNWRWSCIAAIDREIKMDQEPTLIENAALALVWVRGGHGREMRDLFMRKLQEPGAVAPTPRAWVHRMVALICSNLGEVELSRRQFTIALQLYKKLNHQEKIKGALVHLGHLYYLQNKKEESVRCGLAVLKMLEEMDKPAEYAAMTVAMGERLYGSGRKKEGLAYVRRGLELTNKDGTEREQIRALVAVGGLVGKEGDMIGAERYHRAALERSIKSHDLQSEAMALGELARLKRAQGRLDQSIQLLRQSIRACLQINDELGALNSTIELLDDRCSTLVKSPNLVEDVRHEAMLIAELLCAHSVRMRFLGYQASEDVSSCITRIRKAVHRFVPDADIDAIERKMTIERAESLMASICPPDRTPVNSQ